MPASSLPLNLDESLIVTGYNWGQDGLGKTWDAYLEFSGARFYDDLAVFKSGKGMVPNHTTISQDRRSIEPPSLERPLNATGRDIDKAYELLSGKGFKIILCPQGAFANQDIAPTASFRKSPPIDKDADPNDPLSYKPYALLYAQMALRWGPDKNDGLERVYSGGNQWISTDSGTGRNTVWGFQAGNEVGNYAWSGGVVLDEYQTGIMFSICYNEARICSQNARLISPSFLAATAAGAERLFQGFVDGCTQLGVEPRFDWHLSFHRYHRVGNMGQLQVEGDTGATPESVDSYSLYKSIVDVCDKYGALPPMITETGWNDDPTSIGRKQAAPVQNGYDISESKAILTIRDLIIAKAAGLEIMATYHIADDYEQSWGNGMGWFNGEKMDHPLFFGEPRWSKKTCIVTLGNWKSTYGTAFVPRQALVKTVFEDSIVVEAKATYNGEEGVFIWVDGNNKEHRGIMATPFPMFYTNEVLGAGPVEPEPVEPEPVEPSPTLIDLGKTDKGRLFFEPNT